VTRYACISKSQGKPEHVIQDIQILHDKELPPEGFTVIQQTTDNSQKAFKKKQLCYKPTHFKANVESIVDVVVLNKLKNPPDGYDHIGDVNGMHFLIKRISALTRLANPLPQYALPGLSTVYPSLHDSINNLNINSNGNGHSNGHGRMSLPNENTAYSNPNTPSHSIYPEQKNVPYNSQTLPHLSGIEGIPFILREDLRPTVAGGGGIGIRSPSSKYAINIKSQFDVDREYQYDFRAERDVLLSNGL